MVLCSPCVHDCVCLKDYGGCDRMVRRSPCVHDCVCFKGACQSDLSAGAHCGVLSLNAAVIYVLVAWLRIRVEFGSVPRCI